jgi:hypothetical protein
MGVDAIREFSVPTNAYSAEYGRSAGGVVNAISKSGSNDFMEPRSSSFETARWTREISLTVRKFLLPAKSVWRIHWWADLATNCSSSVT